MKIINISYSDTGGGHNAVYRIHQALRNQNINSLMWVVNAKRKDLKVKEILNNFEKIILKFFQIFTRKFLINLLKTKNQTLHSISFFSSNIVNKINSSDADIINLHWIQNEMISIKDISKINKPIIWTLHDMWAFCGAEHYTNDLRWRDGYNTNNRPIYESGFDLNLWNWNRKKKYWKKPIQIVTPSKWLSTCVKKSKLMKNWPVSIIANPINTNLWRPLNKKKACKKLNLPSDKFLILFGAAAGQDYRKGYDLLIKSLNQLKHNQNFKNFHLLIFGKNKEEIKDDYGYPIHYLGHLNKDENLQLAYSASDVMIIPSRQDNLPSTALEAHACGTPVVAFNIGGLADIVLHKKTGYLAKPFNTNDLTNGINWVLNNKNYKELKKNSRKRSINLFSEKKVSKKYINIYKKNLT